MAEDDSLMDATSLPKDALIEKLTRKICIQGTQLGNLGNAFNGSAEYIELCESRIRELESEASVDPEMKEVVKQQNLCEAASKRRDMSEISAKLDESERLLTISNKEISDLHRNLRAKERQCKLNDKKLLELGRETQKMKMQIESFHHASRFSSDPTGSTSARKVVKGLQSEVDALKAYVASYQSRLEASKKAERSLAVKVFDLEESRDYKSQEAYKESQARVLMLTEKVRLLKIELQIEKERATDLLISSPCDTSGVKDNGDADTSVCIQHHDKAVSDQKYGMSSTTANNDCDEKVIALERIIVSLQLKLDEIDRGDKSITGVLREVEQERDILLEFIRGDMKSSADVSEDLQKEKERTEQLRNNLKSIQIKEDQLYTEISNLRLSVCNSKQNMKVYDSEDCIVSILSGELRMARTRVQELESGVESELAKLLLDGNERTNIDRQDMGTLVAISMEDCKASRSPFGNLSTSPLPVSTMASDASTSNSISVVKQPWRQITIHDLDAQCAQSDWQLEKAALVKELNAMRPIDRALAELVSDLKRLKQREDDEDLFDDMEGFSLSDDSFLRVGTAHEEPIRSYSSMYAKNVAVNGKNRSNTSTRNSARDHNLAISLPKTCATKEPSNTLMRNVIGHGKECGVTGLGHTCSDRPNGLLSRRHSWVGLPSIAKLSLALNDRIKKLLLHLHKSETDYFALKEHLKSVESASHKSEIATEQTIQDLTFAAETAEEKRRHYENLLERCESDLRLERGAFSVVESIFDVLCGVPGGWEEFFDKSTLESLQSPKDGHNPLDFKSSENSVMESSLYWPRSMQQNGNIENTSVSSMRGTMGVDGGRFHGGVNRGRGHSSKSERVTHLDSNTASSGLVWTIYGSREGSYGYSSSTPVSLRNMERRTAENSPILSSGVKEEYISIIPPAQDLLPLIMSRAVSMILALSSELRESQMEEISTNSLLTNCQNKLKSREMEYEELKNQFHKLELRYQSREHSFVHIELAMKDDLDLARFHSTEQNIKVVELGSQLESLHRNGSDQHNQQLLRRQRDAYDKEELCNAFREYGFPLTDDLDVSTLSWSDITEHTRNILHDVAQSYQQYPRDRPYPQSASTTPVMPLSLLSPRSTPLVGTTTRSSMSLGSSLIANSVSRLAGSVDEGSATYPNPPYPLLSPNSPHPLNYPNILTPSTDESLEDMESCMTPTTEGSDSYEDDDNDIELSNGFTKRNENDRIRGEEEGGSEKNTYGSDEGESVIEYEGQYKDTEIISAVSPMSLSGLLSSPRIVSNGRQYYHSGVHSQSIKSSIIRSPKKDGAQSRHRRRQKDLIHCFSDISPSPYDISLFPTVPGTSIPSSLHHSKGERDDKGSTLGTISGSYIQSSTPPESTPRENVNICPTEVLDFRLRKARETFASLREDIRSNL